MARGVDQVVVVAMGEGWEVVAVRGVVWVVVVNGVG